MRTGCLLLCLLACACGNDPVAPTKAPAEPPCIVDSLPPLQLHWDDRPECTAENLACRESCANGDANACVSRAHALERSPSGEAEALELFRRGCKLGLATACTNMAGTEWDPGSETMDACLYRVFEKTCEAGDHFGCGMAGRLLVSYRPGLVSLAHGRLLLELACARQGGFACRIVASFIERGTFAAGDRTRIPDLMSRACSTGDDDACGDHATVEETFH